MPITVQTLKKYLNPVFFETGTYMGGGVKTALDAGFDKIITCEVYSPLFRYLKVNFEWNPKVELHFAPSVVVLSSQLPKIDEKITFWLDAHCSGDGTGSDRGKLCPILDELDLIKQYRQGKKDIILIDDVRLFGKPEFSFILQEVVIAKLLEINPDYKIVFEDGHVSNDILVAVP